MIFHIYKREQGKYTRLCSTFAAIIITGLGCMQIYKKLQQNELGLWVETIGPAGLFLALAIVILYLMNKPSIADFLIAAEGEIKKVTWSKKTEIAVSTFVVVAVVIIIAGILGFTDLVFRACFSWILK
jgi:preprotein translocase SecE subunit